MPEMSDPLAVYLHDHLAGSHFAIKLLNSLSEQYKDEELGSFARAICREIEEDQSTLENIIDSVGRSAFDLTEATGWLAEKASQIKLQRDHEGGGIGTFEALETLALGIRGKWSLWQALSRIRSFDSRIPNKNFAELAERADDQYARVEQQRLGLISSTFALVGTHA